MSSMDTAPPRAMIKPIVIMLIAAVLLLGAIFGVQRFFGGMFKKGMAAAAAGSEPEPVRIVLDPKDLEAHPLQVGLSTRVRVSTVDRNGARLPQRAAGGQFFVAAAAAANLAALRSASIVVSPVTPA